MTDNSFYENFGDLDNTFEKVFSNNSDFKNYLPKNCFLLVNINSQETNWLNILF